ncbi:MAG: hypothetical protein Q4E72_06230 [bacterium]|nr:hypothetical protein [bacterium]
MQWLKLRRVSWLMLVPVLAAVIVLFSARYQRGEEQLAAYRDLEAEMKVKLSDAGEMESQLRAKLVNLSDPNTVDAATRAAFDFAQPGELRFEIENSQLLDNYTHEEWQILMDERKLGQF